HTSADGPPAIVEDFSDLYDPGMPTGLPNPTPPPTLVDPRILLPANGSDAANPPQIGSRGSNRGYYLLGPRLGGALGSLVPTLEKEAMIYKIMNPDDPVNPTILLRRLACPNLPPDDRPTVNNQPNLAYNPYVTVDYMEDVATPDTPVA